MAFLIDRASLAPHIVASAVLLLNVSVRESKRERRRKNVQEDEDYNTLQHAATRCNTLQHNIFTWNILRPLARFISLFLPLDVKVGGGRYTETWGSGGGYTLTVDPLSSWVEVEPILWFQFAPIRERLPCKNNKWYFRMKELCTIDVFTATHVRHSWGSLFFAFLACYIFFCSILGINPCPPRILETLAALAPRNQKLGLYY